MIPQPPFDNQPLSPFDDQPEPTDDASAFLTPPSRLAPTQAWPDARWAVHRRQARRVALVTGPALVLLGWGVSVLVLHDQAAHSPATAWPSWWSVWAGWAVLALLGALAAGGSSLLARWGLASPYEFPSCCTTDWLGRPAWRQLPWPRLLRRWAVGRMVHGLLPMVLIVAVVMTLVTGVQDLVVVGLFPSLNLHAPLAPSSLQASGIGPWGQRLVWGVNVGLPWGLLATALAMMWDELPFSTRRLWEHWTLCPTAWLRAHSPAWAAVLNNDWDGVLRETSLTAIERERRSVRGGSLLTQAVLLNAPIGVIDHLLRLGCDPCEAWTPWSGGENLDQWVRNALVSWDFTDRHAVLLPRSSWDATWPHRVAMRGCTLEETRQLAMAFDRRVLQALFHEPADPGETAGTANEAGATEQAPSVPSLPPVRRRL